MVFVIAYKTIYTLKHSIAPNHEYTHDGDANAVNFTSTYIIYRRHYNLTLKVDAGVGRPAYSPVSLLRKSEKWSGEV